MGGLAGFSGMVSTVRRMTCLGLRHACTPPPLQASAGSKSYRGSGAKAGRDHTRYLRPRDGVSVPPHAIIKPAALSSPAWPRKKGLPR